MARLYKPTPCRRCGGEKGPPPYKTARPRYCAPCQEQVRRDYWRKNFKWWCQKCDSPHYCVTCARIKRERFLSACASRKERSQSGYFRPFNAERWWQQRSHSLVQQAIKRGLLPNLKGGDFACCDCGGVAHEYDHRDYGRPFDVEPVCRSCNKQRGTATWPTDERFRFRKIDNDFGPAPTARPRKRKVA